MTGLDFIVIGAQKSGTTTLWQLLRDHPQLSLPGAKEAPFFSEDRSFRRGLDWYLETFFADPRPEAIRGTVTPQYMLGWLESTVEAIAARIHETVPDVKLIALLRDPVARACSHHRMSVLRGFERRPVERALAQQLAPAALTAARTRNGGARRPLGRVQATTRYIVAGEYGRILSAYLDRFDASQLLVLLTADLERDPGTTLERLLAFLGVDDRWRPDDLDVRRFVGGEEPRLGADELRALTALLHAAAPQLPPGVFDAALAEWNTVASGATSASMPDQLHQRLRVHFAADARVLEDRCGVRVPWAEHPPGPPRRRHRVDHPDVSIVVPVHDTVDEAAALLHSTTRHSTGDYEILVLDNGSPSPAREQLASLAETHGARLIRLEENLVFARAVNVGVREARGDEIALLNSDVVVTPNWLSNLRAALHSANDVAIVGPRTNYVRAQQGGIWLDDTSPEGIERFGRFFNHPDPARRFEIDWLSGYAMLFWRDRVLALGGLDESVPWYGQEDRIVCEQLRAAGHRIICAGDTFVYHAGHRTFVRTGINRTATRLARGEGTPQPVQDTAGRLVRDERDLVFEVIDGVASHLETNHVVELLRWGRPIESGRPSEVAGLPLGPPVSACRLKGTDEVWVLRGRVCHRVTGDPHRLRRVQGLSVIDPDDLSGSHRGADLAVEDAIGPIAARRAVLPSNPAEIDPAGLADPAVVASEIESALEAERGYALIRLDRQATLVLNDGIWPTADGAGWRPGAGLDRATAATALRRAIIDADAVGVATGRKRSDEAGLLEQALFHYDLYPRLRCEAEVGEALLGLGSGVATGPVAQMLEGRPVAVVCPAALIDVIDTRARRFAHARGVTVARLAVGLDDLSEAERALMELAAQRESFDAVLICAGVAGAVLAARLARELDVVALDLGPALHRVLHPRLSTRTAALAHTRWELQQYLRAASTPPQQPPHELEGHLVRARGEREVFYVERGRARRVAHRSLVALLGSGVIEVDPDALTALPSGAPICVVHERLTGPYLLVNGRKLPVALGMELVELEDRALVAVPTADDTLRWFPGLIAYRTS